MTTSASPTVFIDNDRVRVTEWRFAPEAATGWHRHEHDYVVVPLMDGKLRLVAGDGQVSEATLSAGVPYYRETGVEHDVVNGSGHEFAFIEVEVKYASARLRENPTMSAVPERVTAHYGGADLRERIESALAAVGKGDGLLSTRDVAPVDEFHSRGREATRELAELAAPGPGEHMLDVGSGIGGPARYVAERFGCRVSGVDLTPTFCAVASWLSERTGLADRVAFRQGSATDLPFPDETFDVAWTIQVQMNVADKGRFYEEIQRVLKPGGRFVCQDLCAGEAGPAHFPTPWASDPGTSFLAAPDALRECIEASGLQVASWRETTDAAIAWYELQRAKATHAEPSPLGIHLVMGENAASKRANVERSFRQGRLRQVIGAFVKA